MKDAFMVHDGNHLTAHGAFAGDVAQEVLIKRVEWIHPEETQGVDRVSTVQGRPHGGLQTDATDRRLRPLALFESRRGKDPTRHTATASLFRRNQIQTLGTDDVMHHDIHDPVPNMGHHIGPVGKCLLNGTLMIMTGTNDNIIDADLEPIAGITDCP